MLSTLYNSNSSRPSSDTKTSRPLISLAALLVFFLGLKLASLSFTDLIDPTESRYAAVAQQMALSGNWLTPMLPYPEGDVAYLGKPPLHFWLTAISYKLFGINEFSSRLPSFLGLVGILWLQIWFCLRFFNYEVATLSCFVSLASSIFFFGGASVVDVTLTFFICGGIFSYAWYESINPDHAKKRQLAAAVIALSTALGFLIKGPVTIILVGLPIGLWILLTKSLASLKHYPWFISAVVFLLVAVPWFYLSEIDNPGFLKYFFWNENVGRYLDAEYGDRYGSGHIFPKGTAWIMLFAVAAPWSLLIIPRFAHRLGLKEFRLYIKNLKNSPDLFLILVALSPAIFFTFAEQLHSAYMLPAIPSFSILTAKAITNHTLQTKHTWKLYNSVLKFLLHFSFVFSIGFFVYLSIAHPSFKGLTTIFAIIVSTILLAAITTKNIRPRLKLSVRATSLIVMSLLCSVIALTPYLNRFKSTDMMLNEIAELTPDTAPIIGVTNKNYFSFYWSTRSWKDQLSKPIRIVFADFSKPETLPPNILIRDGQMKFVPPSVKEQYNLRLMMGKWIWLVRK